MGWMCSINPLHSLQKTEMFSWKWLTTSKSMFPHAVSESFYTRINLFLTCFWFPLQWLTTCSSLKDKKSFSRVFLELSLHYIKNLTNYLHCIYCFNKIKTLPWSCQCGLRGMAMGRAVSNIVGQQWTTRTGISVLVFKKIQLKISPPESTWNSSNKLIPNYLYRLNISIG